MKIPTKLKIGAHTVKVSVEPLEDKSGDWDVRVSTIRIDKSIPQSHKEATLFHEIFHVLNSTINHTVLDSFAEQMYQVFKDNGLLNES